jgi:hypothetical protein
LWNKSLAACSLDRYGAFWKNNQTMRILSLLLGLTLLISCQDLQDKKNIIFISKVETIGIDKFKKIGYGTRGNQECYDFCLTNDSSVSWMYNRETNQFEFPLVYQDFGKVAIDFKAYITDLREAIQSLNVVMITQSPWCGNIVRFWITREEIIAYVNPEFKFDDRGKNEWLKEIRSGHKIKKDWYYIKIKK